jgi:hypothetical protein
LLAISGLPDKILNYFMKKNKSKDISDLIKNLEPAGKYFADERIINATFCAIQCT